MKGFSFQPLNRRNFQKTDLALWDRWLDVESPLRFATKGGVPNVVGKAAVLCSSNLAKIVNILSIIHHDSMPPLTNVGKPPRTCKAGRSGAPI